MEVVCGSMQWRRRRGAVVATATAPTLDALAGVDGLRRESKGPIKSHGLRRESKEPIKSHGLRRESKEPIKSHGLRQESKEPIKSHGLRRESKGPSHHQKSPPGIDKSPSKVMGSAGNR